MTNNNNRVRLIGKLTRDPKSGQGATTAWCFATILPNGDKGGIDVKAFGGAAGQLAAFQEGAAVTIEAHLAPDKPKEQGGKWSIMCVCDSVAATR